ncbi:MAG: hypothetical protein HQM15_05800 [Deltaproteobacteria bacterium]|nr:hypothetical protein [Deltaproteobacteria bacterium]
MQNNKKTFFFIFLLLTYPLLCMAQAMGTPPVVAANGFGCVKTQMMVSCKGRFPGVPGTFSASGAHQVNITYETPDLPGNRFSFDSSNGCLMRVSFDRGGRSTEVTVWNAAAISKSFLMPMQQAEASRFCQGK